MESPNSTEKTEQELFWASDFGSEYTDRNSGRAAEANSLQMRAMEIAKIQRPVHKILELGANRGINILALQQLLPEGEFTGVEINESASKILSTTGCEVINKSILNYAPTEKFDLVLLCGVLIHINPESLQNVYSTISIASRRYVLISEYYNPVPVGIAYRGHENKLFKRDFAGEFLDLNPDFALRDYGFHYRKGSYSGDDQTWFLLERTN